MRAGPSHGKLHFPLKPGELWSLLALSAIRWATHNYCSCLAVRLRIKSKLRTNLDGKRRTRIVVDILEGPNQPALHEDCPSPGLSFVCDNKVLVKVA